MQVQNETKSILRLKNILIFEQVIAQDVFRDFVSIVGVKVVFGDTGILSKQNLKFDISK